MPLKPSSMSLATQLRTILTLLPSMARRDPANFPCPGCHDNDRTLRGFLVGSCEDFDGTAKGDGLVEVHRFALNMFFGITDENDLANETAVQNGIGTGRSNVATADDRDTGAR